MEFKEIFKELGLYSYEGSIPNILVEVYRTSWGEPAMKFVIQTTGGMIPASISLTESFFKGKFKKYETH